MGYILEIISTYAVHQCDPSKRSLSLISRRKPFFYSFTRSLAFFGPFKIALRLFTDQLWAHAQVVGMTLAREKVRVVLGNAMRTYQTEVLGIYAVWHTKGMSSGESWRDLARALISEDEEKKIRSGRWRREWKEANENAKAAAKVEAELR